MRSFVTFLIGCVFGATAVLMVTAKGAPVRAESRGGLRPPVDGRTPSLLIPVQGVQAESIKSNFAERRGGGRMHEAIDIRATRGTPVLAVADGTIRKLFTSAAGGLTIYHYDLAESTCYYYAHLDRYAEILREGQRVSRGDVIGYVGTSGNAPPDTPHLHFAIMMLTPTREWWKGSPVDPYPYLTSAATQGGSTTPASRLP